MARFGIGSRILSANLPLGPRASTPEAATAFFGGLLPVRFIAHGTRNLLDGKAAGVGGAHPSLVALGPVPAMPPRR